MIINRHKCYISKQIKKWIGRTMSPRLIRRIGYTLLFLGSIFFVLQILFAYFIPSHSFAGAAILNLGFFYRDFVTVLLGASVFFLISGFGALLSGFAFMRSEQLPWRVFVKKWCECALYALRGLNPVGYTVIMKNMRGLCRKIRKVCLFFLCFVLHFSEFCA